MFDSHLFLRLLFCYLLNSFRCQFQGCMNIFVGWQIWLKKIVLQLTDYRFNRHTVLSFDRFADLINAVDCGFIHELTFLEHILKFPRLRKNSSN